MRHFPPLIGRLAAVLTLLFAREGAAQFTEVVSPVVPPAGLIEPASPCAAWADYDGDGDLDLLIAGAVAGTPTTILYEYDAAAFADSGILITGLESAASSWGDYDNDGDLDLAITGLDATSEVLTRVYRNDGGTAFVDIFPVSPFTLGNNAAVDGPTLDGWLSVMVIDELQTYTNTSGSPESIRIDTFNFYARAEASPLTPFVVKVNGDNDFTVLAVGTTRTGVDYDVGANSLPFSDGTPPVVALAAGETLAVGFSDANADGSGGGAGGVIPFDNASNTWFTGGPGANDSGSLVVGAPPTLGPNTFTQLSRDYRFNIGFSDITGSLTNVYDGSLAWGDYDNDGDLDLVVTGITGVAGSPETRLYRNDGSDTFTPVPHPFPHVHLSAVAWGDYDDDGDLDIVIMGAPMSGLPEGGLFRNDGGAFVDAGAGLPATQVGFVEWGDYDSDGDLDLLLGGQSPGAITKLYQNNAGVLTEVGAAAAALPDLLLSSAGWGDYDNDGDLDIAINGFDPSAGTRKSRLFRNDAGTFVDSAEVFPDVLSGVVAWGDRDNDGDLDLVLGGQTAPAANLLRLYGNGSAVANTAPAVPANLATLVQGSSVTFTWDATTDDLTPAPGLSYAIRVGTTMGGSEIASSGADASTGYRRLPSPGNIRNALAVTLAGLAPGTYYWSVQSVDGSYLGSSFAAEASFIVLPAAPEIVSIATEPVNKVRVTWSGTPGSTYSVEASSDLSPASWTEIATPTANGTTGLFDILEDLAAFPQRYYRAVRP